MSLPPTPINPVVDHYHGIPVEDPYRWLEDPSQPDVRQWVQAQNDFTRACLDQIPFREKIYQEIKRLQTATSSRYYALWYIGGRLFAMKLQPPLQQSMLVTLTSADDLPSEAVVVDPNQLDPSGGTAIDFYVPSHDGRLVAVSLSQGGSEEGNVRVYETATGRQLSDEVPRVNSATAGGSVAWNGDASGFFYTRYPRGDERPPEDRDFYQQVYFHRLGESTEQDTYVIGEEFPRIAEIELETSEDGRYLLAEVKNGDGGEIGHWLRGPDEQWQQVTRFEDEGKEARIGEDGYLYMLSRKDAPLGKIIRMPLDRPVLAEAETIVPEQDGSIRAFLPTASRIYIAQLDGGPSRLISFDLQGNRLGEVPTEPISSIYAMVKLEGDEILYYSGSFVTLPAWFHYDPASDTTTRTALFVSSPADFGDMEVVRVFATSRDGTRVPVNIIYRKGTMLNGQNPTLLTGYGGYGISLQPVCRINNRVWFDAGGIFAVANLRGGGEYGEEWHTAGNLINKQNVFDDFIACAQLLIERGYTSPEKLSIIGGSNGGLLMGAAFTQRPELFRAVVSEVGIYDMLRVELDPNGVFNITEFGTVTNPQHFEALYDYSPYHRVVDGTAYPAILFTTGKNDGRVNPAQSRKMTARMQTATGSDLPVLLRTNMNAGHGMGMPLEEQIQLDTDIFCFLMDQVGAQPK